MTNDWKHSSDNNKREHFFQGGASLPPVSSFISRKNFWLKMNATPLISSTLASAVVFLLMKLAVMAMASFPLNSFLLKPGRENEASKTANQRKSRRDTEDQIDVEVNAEVYIF